MGGTYAGKLVKVMRYRPPLSMYENPHLLVRTTEGIFMGPDGGELEPVTDPFKARLYGELLDMENPHGGRN